MQQNKRRQGIWSYREWLGVPDDVKAVSLGEGHTPLLEAKNLESILGIKKLFLKNESVNPSGTYKDRFATVAVSLEKWKRTSAIALGSAGNAAASLAAYAAVADIPCVVLLPNKAVKERAMQIMSYGAKFLLLEDTIDKCIRLAEEGDKKGLWKNVSTTTRYYPQGTEGYKTIAYELAEQMNYQVPDWIVCPVGGGSLISKIYEGFVEMKQREMITAIPRFAAVQAEGCKPLVEAYEKGEKKTEKWENPDTIAFAIADIDTFEGETVLQLIEETQGTAVSVDDEDIRRAMILLSTKEAVLAEPSSAVTAAAAEKLLQKKIMKEEESAVCIITGNAMRDLKLLTDRIPVPDVIEDAALETVLKRYREFY